jgi:pimeloyl-ACP methyl ester carboxylesterase
MLVAADVGQGPVVVLLHGFPLTRAMWKPQVEALRDLYRVITPDLPGLGDSPLGPKSIDGFADAVAALLDEKDLKEPVSLGGLSMGGYVAMAFARRHPDRLRSLILCDTKAGPDDAAMKLHRDKLITQARSGDVAGIIEAQLPKLLGQRAREESPELVELLRQLGSSQRPEGVAAALVAMRDRPDALPGLKAVQAPTLVVVGQEDQITPPELSREIAAAVPGAKLAVIDKAGHMSNLEEVGAFNDVLLGFLAGVA